MQTASTQPRTLTRDSTGAAVAGGAAVTGTGGVAWEGAGSAPAGMTAPLLAPAAGAATDGCETATTLGGGGRVGSGG